jgi:hypothetical protein
MWELFFINWLTFPLVQTTDQPSISAASMPTLAINQRAVQRILFLQPIKSLLALNEIYDGDKIDLWMKPEGPSKGNPRVARYARPTALLAHLRDKGLLPAPR